MKNVLMAELLAHHELKLKINNNSDNNNKSVFDNYHCSKV